MCTNHGDARHFRLDYACRSIRMIGWGRMKAICHGSTATSVRKADREKIDTTRRRSHARPKSLAEKRNTCKSLGHRYVGLGNGRLGVRGHRVKLEAATGF
jgi:hypothetical protein